MERKIGEIFEFGGKWYQCVNYGFSCADCDIKGDCSSTHIGACSSRLRKDGKQVRFKKLKKVGEPYEFDGHLFQSYHTFEVPIFTENYATVREFGNNSKISIEIKQNKEDMEDLDKIKVRDYTKVEELNIMEENKLNLKPFDLEAAKAGKPVCTRDGRKARIICFDRVGDFPIVALTDDREYKEEGVNLYDINGKGSNECFDLMMLPEKKEGWINVKKDAGLFKSREEAERNCTKDYATVRVEFEI